MVWDNLKRREYNKQYYERNKIKINQQSLDWQKKNPKRAYERTRRWVEKTGYSKKYRESNRKKLLEYSKQYYRKNKSNLNKRRLERLAATRALALISLGGICRIESCIWNSYSEKIRFKVLEIHHLNGNPKKERSSQLFTKIIKGEIGGLQLLCASHHALADGYGKSGWDAWISLNE